MEWTFVFYLEMDWPPLLSVFSFNRLSPIPISCVGATWCFFFLFFSYCDWGGWFHTNKVVPKIPILAQLDNLLSQLCDDHNHSNYTTKIIMVITIVVIVSIKRLWDTNVFSKRNLLYLYSCRDQYADFKCENYVNIYSKFCQILFSSIPKKVCFEKCVVWNFGILQA